jgi:hypothetical protein
VLNNKSGVMIMKKVKKSNRSAKKSRLWTIGIITTLMVGGFSSNAHAINILQTINDLKKGANSLIEEFKKNPAVVSIVTKLNDISTIYMPEIQKITNLSNADADKIKGVLGQLTPKEAAQAVENQAKQQPTTTTNTSTDSKVSTATTTIAAQQGLSKEAQEANKKVSEEVSGLVDDSEATAFDSTSSADEAQYLSSSQDVLKVLSRQAGNQSAMTAAQVRIAAFQNSNLQEIKTQLAASNQANASFEKRQEGKAQEEQIQNYAKSMGIIANNRRNYE